MHRTFGAVQFSPNNRAATAVISVTHIWEGVACPKFHYVPLVYQQQRRDTTVNELSQHCWRPPPPPIHTNSGTHTRDGHESLTVSNKQSQARTVSRLHPSSPSIFVNDTSTKRLRVAKSTRASCLYVKLDHVLHVYRLPVQRTVGCQRQILLIKLIESVASSNSGNTCLTFHHSRFPLRQCSISKTFFAFFKSCIKTAKANKLGLRKLSIN